MICFYRKTIVLWMFACTFGCIAICAQPSLKGQKVKVEKWDRKLKEMQRQYSSNRSSLGKNPLKCQTRFEAVESIIKKRQYGRIFRNRNNFLMMIILPFTFSLESLHRKGKRVKGEGFTPSFTQIT